MTHSLSIEMTHSLWIGALSMIDIMKQACFVCDTCDMSIARVKRVTCLLHV